MSGQKVILDTDIGDDVDDVMALGLILASPELELLGVTTVFRNTMARAKQARTVLRVAGREDVPVAIGCGDVLARDVDYLGNQDHPFMGYLRGDLPNQDSTCLPENELPACDPRHGVDFLIETILAGAGDITLITIGSMTNLGMALVKEPKIRAKIPKIISMAGAFDGRPEWNIRCDPLAARIVADSDIPVDWIPLDVTTRVKFDTERIERLRDCDKPLAKKMMDSIDAWQAHSGWGDGLPVMHDPLAVATMLQELVEWKTGRVDVVTDAGPALAWTIFRPDKNGKHRYAHKVDPAATLDFWLERITAYECRGEECGRISSSSLRTI